MTIKPISVVNLGSQDIVYFSLQENGLSYRQVSDMQEFYIIKQKFKAIKKTFKDNNTHCVVTSIKI